MGQGIGVVSGSTIFVDGASKDVMLKSMKIKIKKSFVSRDSTEGVYRPLIKKKHIEFVAWKNKHTEVLTLLVDDARKKKEKRG